MRKYDAWGQYRNDTAPSPNEPKLGFTGHQYDPETGLVYARARYYDPEMGRFLSRDVNEGSIANAPSLHRYSYAHGNPTVYVDKDGRSATAVGTALGFAWGTGQAIGGLISLGLQELTGGAVVSNVGSIGDVLGLVAQNTIGGFEMGLSLDMAVASGGMAVAAGSGALGFAGADAITLQGKARSASDFAISQVVEGGKGAAVGVGLGVVGKGVSAAAKTAVGEFVVRETVEAVGAVAKTSAGQAVTGAARAVGAKVVPALRALGAEADEAAVDVGLGWMPSAGRSLAGKLNAAEALAKAEVAAAWTDATTPWTGPGQTPSGTPRVMPGGAILQGPTEVVQRVMSQAELDATLATGLVRGGRGGTHYVTDAASRDALRARQRLALQQTPEIRAKLEVPQGAFSEPTTVEEMFGMPGGGSERTASGQVPAIVVDSEKMK